MIATFIKSYWQLKNKKPGTIILFPDQPLGTQSLINKLQRNELMLTKKYDEMGIRVTHVPKLSSLRQKIKKNDILIQVDEYPIASNGVVHYKGVEITLDAYIALKQKKDQVSYLLLRQPTAGGALEQITVQFSLESDVDSLCLLNQAPNAPLNYIVLPNGCVFVEPTKSFIDSYMNIIRAPGRVIYDSSHVPGDLDGLQHAGLSEKMKYPPVFLQGMLSHEQTTGADDFTGCVKKVNDIKIKNIFHFSKLIAKLKVGTCATITLTSNKIVYYKVPTAEEAEKFYNHRKINDNLSPSIKKYLETKSITKGSGIFYNNNPLVLTQPNVDGQKQNTLNNNLMQK